LKPETGDLKITNRMTTPPHLERRPAVKYIGIRSEAAADQLPIALPPLFGELWTWLERHGIAPVGVPFVRYCTVDRSGAVPRFGFEVGFPVRPGVESDGNVVAGELPAGSYVVALYTGPYTGLREANADVFDWARREGVVLQHSNAGVEWRAWLEFCVMDPSREPDPSKWQTEIAILTAG
jgi:effector-binding domain-containing protein